MATILNPETGRMVKADGKIGQTLLLAQMAGMSIASPPSTEMILNPATGRLVKADGSVGKAIKAASAAPNKTDSIKAVKKTEKKAVPVNTDKGPEKKKAVPVNTDKEPEKKKAVPDGMVLNPKTNRLVKADGAIGKLVLATKAP